MDQEEIDKPYIERRVAEWANRIDALYSIVQDALSGMREISTSMSRSISMNEELMQKYSVPGRELPILDIKKNGQIIATLKPIGLWVIGANGRVDLLSEKGSYILVDHAEHGTTPDWKVFTPSNRTKSESFDANFIRRAVK